MSFWDSTFNQSFNFSPSPFQSNYNNPENKFNVDFNSNCFNNNQLYSSQHFPAHSSFLDSKFSIQTSSKTLPTSFPELYRYESPYLPRTQDHAIPFERPHPMWRNDERRMKQNTSIQVELENKSLLERFDKFCTEMIITKSGRRMFPSPVISVKGLQATKKYFILLDIVPADDNRYKYQHFNWVIAGKAEPPPPPRMYIHPDSPLAGSHWMKQKISFAKVKLTNNTCDQMGHIVLNSMHRYQPRIHVVEADDVYSMQFQPFHTYVFPECCFIAVTAYQNSQVTNLKIENNPFAKGFREVEKQKRAKRKSQFVEDSMNNLPNREELSVHQCEMSDNIQMKNVNKESWDFMSEEKKSKDMKQENYTEKVLLAGNHQHHLENENKTFLEKLDNDSQSFNEQLCKPSSENFIFPSYRNPESAIM